MQCLTQVLIIMSIKYLIFLIFLCFRAYMSCSENNNNKTLLSSYSRGIQKSTFRVTKGGPLPFSFDILSSAFKYGNRCFTYYPEGMPDYFKQAFPAGMSYERSFTFEDGGVATASGHIGYESNI